MKTTQKIFFFLFLPLMLYPQKINLGLKAGMVYNTNGEVSSSQAYKTITSSGGAGFNLGVYTSFKLSKFLIQPEFYYTQFTKSYSINQQTASIVSKRIDLPVLVAYKFLFLRVYSGPVFSYYLADNISLNDINQVRKDNMALGFQLGAGINIKKLKVDVRYDQALSQRLLDFVSNNEYFSVSTNRPTLLMLSVGYDLF